MLLRPRITAAFLLTSVVPIILIGSLTYFYVKKSMEQSVFDGIQVISELKEANLYLYLEKIKTTTRDYASDGFVRDSIESIGINATNKEKIEKTLNEHLIKNKAPLNADVLYIDVLDVKGVVKSSTRADRIGIDNSRERYFIKAKQNIYINDVRRHDEGDFEIELAAPLFSRTDATKLVGVLVNHFTINSIKSLFNGDFIVELGAKTQSRGLGRTGETYVVNKNKFMINDSLFVDDAGFRQLVDTYPVKMGFEQGSEVTGIWKDYRGVDVVGASMVIEIDDFKWTLITEQDVNEAFSAVENLKKIYAMIIIILTAFVFLMSIFISRKITHPIGMLTRAMGALGKGERQPQIKDIQRDDEIGLFAQTFEIMSLRLNTALEDIQKKNQQLEELSNRDGLTGLFNHRHLKEALDMEFNRSYRYKTPLCCVMLDIDYFKSINDTYGHLFGDVVLKGVAEVIMEGCRKSDITARYGGEEFIALLPNTDLKQARFVAKKLFEMIKTTEYFDEKNRISITVSIGISFFHEGVKKYSDMIAEADQAMYQAKNNGRNQICVFGNDKTE